MSARLRRTAALCVTLVVAMAGCSSPPETIDPSAGFTYADLPDGDTLCARIPLLQLAHTAGWSLEREAIRTDGPVDTGRFLRGGCRFKVHSDFGIPDAPVYSGDLGLEVSTADDVRGVASSLHALIREGDYDEGFAAYGTYQKQDIPIEGWWSKGTATTYTQDFSGAEVFTRVLVTAQISDANVTASILVKAMISGDSVAALDRLRTLATDTLLALHDALDRRVGA
ncbi:hypothetical protein BH09ACT12_BH09ACT12_31470 [soil metagenome]